MAGSGKKRKSSGRKRKRRSSRKSGKQYATPAQVAEGLVTPEGYYSGAATDSGRVPKVMNPTFINQIYNHGVKELANWPSKEKYGMTPDFLKYSVRAHEFYIKLSVPGYADFAAATKNQFAGNLANFTPAQAKAHAVEIVFLSAAAINPASEGGAGQAQFVRNMGAARAPGVQGYANWLNNYNGVPVAPGIGQPPLAGAAPVFAGSGSGSNGAYNFTPLWNR